MIKGGKKGPMCACTAAVALATAVAFSVWTSYAHAQTRIAPGPFTEAQTQAGQAVYNSRCASCHDAGGETIRLLGASCSMLAISSSGDGSGVSHSSYSGSSGASSLAQMIKTFADGHVRRMYSLEARNSSDEEMS